MTETLLQIHSTLRYAVLVVGVVAAAYALVGWARGHAYGPTARRLGFAFTVTLDLQALLGLVLLVLWPFYPALMGHITMMIAALAVAHITAVRARRGPSGFTALRTQALGILITLGLIVAGILAIGRTPV